MQKKPLCFAASKTQRLIRLWKNVLEGESAGYASRKQDQDPCLQSRDIFWILLTKNEILQWKEGKFSCPMRVERGEPGEKFLDA